MFFFRKMLNFFSLSPLKDTEFLRSGGLSIPNIYQHFKKFIPRLFFDEQKDSKSFLL